MTVCTTLAFSVGDLAFVLAFVLGFVFVFVPTKSKIVKRVIQ